MKNLLQSHSDNGGSVEALSYFLHPYQFQLSTDYIVDRKTVFDHRDGRNERLLQNSRS